MRYSNGIPAMVLAYYNSIGKYFPISLYILLQDALQILYDIIGGPMQSTELYKSNCIHLIVLPMAESKQKIGRKRRVKGALRSSREGGSGPKKEGV